MKKHLFIFAGLFFLSLFAVSQSQLNLVVFSEDGDAFYAYINGVRQNDKPETNVKITGLTSPNISLRIEFSDKALPQLKQNMALEMGYEHTAKIKRDMKKQLKLRYFGQTPLNDPATAGAPTVAYHTVENSSPAASDMGQTQTSNNTITTTTSSTQFSNSMPNSSVNMGMGGAGITVNMNGMDPNAGMNGSSSTTVTTSSSSSSSSSSSTGNNNNSNNYNDNHNNYNGNHHNSHQNNNAPAASASAGCTYPMTDANFAKMKQSVEAKPFSDTKMSTAKIATKNACLSVSQVKEICKLFKTDDDKMDYAKSAYPACIDKASYYQVAEVFTFSTTTDEFNKFLEQQ